MAEDFELVSVEPGIAKRRPAPVLIQDGDRLVPSDRTFHPALAAEYIRDRGGRTRWISVAELARIFFQRDSKSNRTRIRRRIHRIWDAVLNMGLLLVYDVQRDGVSVCTCACKIYNPQSMEEQQALHARLQRMDKTRQRKAEQFVKALTLAECQETAVLE
jgi:hypothetical protein